MARTDEERKVILQQQLDQIDDLILKITVKPKPTYDIDGQMVKWTEYLEMLSKQRTALEQKLIDIDGPFEVETQGYC